MADADAEAAIARLVETLGCPRDQAEFFYGASGGDVDAAVSMYYEHVPDASAPPTRPSGAAPSAPGDVEMTPLLGVAAGRPPSSLAGSSPRPGAGVAPRDRAGPLPSPALAAARLPLLVVRAALGAVLRALGALARLIARALPASVASSLRRLARACTRPVAAERLSPDEAARAFARELEDLWRSRWVEEGALQPEGGDSGRAGDEPRDGPEEAAEAENDGSRGEPTSAQRQSSDGDAGGEADGEANARARANAAGDANAPASALPGSFPSAPPRGGGGGGGGGGAEASSDASAGPLEPVGASSSPSSAPSSATPRPLTPPDGAPLIAWLPCGWREAARRAAREDALLFAYLHASDAAAARAFALGPLREPRVRRALAARGYVAWGGDVAQPDARALASALGGRRAPHAALLAAEPGDRVRLVAYARGASTSAPALLDLLTRVADERDATRARARQNADRVEAARRLRAEQDASLARSLAEDRARAQRREQEAREKREREEREEREREEKERAEREAREEEERAREGRTRRLVERKAARQAALDDRDDVGAAGGRTAVLRLRLPSGATHQRRFAPAASLADVAAWADTLPGAEDVDSFSLASAFPRRVYGDADLSKSLEELGLVPQAALLFQPLDE